MDIQIPQIIFQIINFSIVVFVLQKFLFKPILKVLNQRAEKIESGLKAAENNLKKESEIEKRADEEIKNARREAQKILKDTKQSANSEAEAIKKKAREDAKKAIESERLSFERLMEKEREQMAAQLASMVTDTTRSLIKSVLTKEEQKRIIDSQIKQLETIKLA